MKEPELKVKGKLKIEVFDVEKQKVIQKYEDHNVIVNNALLQICRFIGNLNSSPVTKIGFGEGRNPPQATDFELTNSYIRAVTNSQVDDGNKSVTFNFQLDTSEYNGHNIREMGLYCENETLFSRRTIAVPIEKTVNIAIFGSWTIEISQSV